VATLTSTRWVTAYGYKTSAFVTERFIIVIVSNILALLRTAFCRYVVGGNVSRYFEKFRERSVCQAAYAGRMTAVLTDLRRPVQSKCDRDDIGVVIVV
jgi:hypothetical protein